MSGSKARHGFFRSVVDAMIAAREKQAESYVHNALLTFDDETLRAHGYSPEKVRRRGGGGYLF